MRRGRRERQEAEDTKEAEEKAGRLGQASLPKAGVGLRVTDERGAHGLRGTGAQARRPHPREGIGHGRPLRGTGHKPTVDTYLSS